ncbi:MAG: hypothetical protein ACXAC5_00580 [Promethearchaeota archaeon]|jgi:hypothetical protein
MLKVRVIKSEGCFRCKNYLKQLKLQNFDHLIYDADLKENQEELNKWKVDMMPVVQIVDDEAEFKVVHQFPPGRWSTRSINAKVKALAKQEKKE